MLLKQKVRLFAKNINRAYKLLKTVLGRIKNLKLYKQIYTKAIEYKNKNLVSDSDL